MSQSITISSEQATVLAAAILPDIRAYIDTHREEYEEFLKGWRVKQEQAKGDVNATS